MSAGVTPLTRPYAVAGPAQEAPSRQRRDGGPHRLLAEGGDQLIRERSGRARRGPPSNQSVAWHTIRAARVYRPILEIAGTEWRIWARQSHSGSNKEEG